MAKRHNSDMTFNPEAGANGAYTDKVKGKRPSKPRPALVLDNFDLAGVKPSMPLADFFDKMSVDKNAAVFIQERDNGKIHDGKERRSTIKSLLSIIERVYPALTTSCNSDLDCITRLLQAPQLVTKANFVGVYKALQTLMTKVLYGPADFNALHHKMSTFKQLINTHEWFLPPDVIKLDFFKISQMAFAALKRYRSRRVEENLADNIKIPDHTVLQIVRKLKAIVDDTDHDIIEWFNAAVSLLQVSTGARFIEAAWVSYFDISDEPEVYEPTKYIKVTGIAKVVLFGAYKKEYHEAVENNDLEKLAELDEKTSEEVKASIDDAVIMRPMIFQHLGVTPQLLVDLSVDIKKYVRKICGSEPELKDIDAALLAGSNRFFATLWSPTMLASFKRSKSHMWRKIYANYSFKLYDPDGSINSWIMKVLGHSDLMSSHNYANVNIVIGLKVADPDLKAAMSAMREEMNNIKEENARLKVMMQDIQAAIKPPQPGNDGDNIDFDELEDDDAPRIHLVALPKISGGFVYVKPFDKKLFHRRFRTSQQQEKDAWTQEMKDKIKAVIGDNVVMSKMTDALWIQLNVPRVMGRELSGK